MIQNDNQDDFKGTSAIEAAISYPGNCEYAVMLFIISTSRRMRNQSLCSPYFVLHRR